MNLRLRLNKADSPARPSHTRRNSYSPIHTAELHYLCLHPVAKRFRRLAQAAASRPPCTSPPFPSPFAAILDRPLPLAAKREVAAEDFQQPGARPRKSSWCAGRVGLVVSERLVVRPAWCSLGWCAESCLAMSGGERGGLEGRCDEGAWLEPLCVFALSFVVVARRECRAGLAREERYPVCC